MTITATATEISYAGDGTTRAFPVPFPFDTSADLKVVSTDADGTPAPITTGFSVSGGGGAGGTVTFVVAPSASVDITIIDNPARTQPTDYTDNDPFPAESHEDALDRVTRLCKRLYQISLRALRFQDGDPETDGEIGSVESRKGKYLHFNETTGAVEYAASIGETTLTAALIDSLLLGPSGTIKGRQSAGTGLLENLVAKDARAVQLIPDHALGVQFFSGAPYYSLGDSITAGNAAGANLGYANIIANHMRCSFTNLAVSGRGVTECLVQSYTSMPAYGMRRINATLMAGFNDLHFNGGGLNTLQKIRNVTRSILANLFLKTAVSADDASVTLTGSWSNSTSGVWGEKATASGLGNAMYCVADATAKASWTFTGDSVVVGLWSSDGSVYSPGPKDIYIDGALVETFIPLADTDGNSGLGDTYEGLTHATRVYWGLGNGSHTIEVRNTTSSIIMVDYFGTLSAPGDCPCVLVGEVPYVDAVGYATVETLRSEAIDDSASALIREEVALFAARGFPVAIVPVNDFYDAETEISGDHDHPGVVGHHSLAKAYLSRVVAVPKSILSSASLFKTPAQSIADVTSTAITWSSVTGDAEFYAAATPSRIFGSGSAVRISGRVVWDANTTGVRIIQIRKNGGAALYLDTRPANNGTDDTCQSFCIDMAYALGDYFEIIATQNSGGALDVQVESQVDVMVVR